MLHPKVAPELWMSRTRQRRARAAWLGRRTSCEALRDGCGMLDGFNCNPAAADTATPPRNPTHPECRSALAPSRKGKESATGTLHPLSIITRSAVQ